MANANGWGDGSVNNSIGWGKGAINNSIGWGSSQLTSWSGATDIDGGDAPTNTVAPALSGTAQEGQTLTCSTGTWTGSPTYTYQWKRNGNNITSATNSTYTLVTADVGQSIKCTVTATNILGSASADSNTVVPTSSVDADAQAFITAAGITNPTQQNAIITLVTDLKGYSIWTKFKAIYPIVGGTSSAHAVNLKTPGTYNLTFASGMTHSSTGMNGNATSYADTNFNPVTQSSAQNNFFIGFYSRTNISGIYYDMGNTDNWTVGTKYTGIISKYSNNNRYISICDAYSSSNAESTTLGFYCGGTNGNSTQTLYKNGVNVLSGTSQQTGFSNRNIFLCAVNNNNTATAPTPREYSFWFISEGLSSTQAANFYTAVQAFQTTLSRQV